MQVWITSYWVSRVSRRHGCARHLPSDMPFLCFCLEVEEIFRACIKFAGG